MKIRDPRGGLYFGLAVEALLAGAGLFFLVVAPRGGERIALLSLGVAALWGGLLALSYAFMVNLRANENGVHGKLGFSRVDLAWDEIESIAPLYAQVRLVLRDGTFLEFRVPGWSPREVARIFDEMHGGKIVRVIGKDGDIDLGKSQPRYPIPSGVETYLALERNGEQLSCVNVLVGGAKLKDVARAARVLAVRAADEHRWDATFSGKIRILVSAQRTPISEKLNPLMDAAIAGAREDLQAKGWSVVGGAQFSLSWEVMGKNHASP